MGLAEILMIVTATGFVLSLLALASQQPITVPIRPQPRKAPPKSEKSDSTAERSDTAPKKPTTTGTVESSLPKLYEAEADDVDPTKLTVTASGTGAPPAAEAMDTPTVPPAVPITFDPDAEIDEPTAAHAYILVVAAGQTDQGLKRKRNEDTFVLMDVEGVYAIADGMGGHGGGAVASKIATDTIRRVFEEGSFPGKPHKELPKRGSELARAIYAANMAIFKESKTDQELSGMGTTIVAARFSPRKQRMYIGHVGDSRCYRLRKGELRQMTTDHTMELLGVTGQGKEHLSRAVGVADNLKVDVLLGKPSPEDVYLLCSDGLNKMVKDDLIRDVLLQYTELDKAVDRLIAAANEKGGKDNITVILIKVLDPVAAARANMNEKATS